jgi:hypothetical protein
VVAGRALDRVLDRARQRRRGLRRRAGRDRRTPVDRQRDRRRGARLATAVRHGCARGSCASRPRASRPADRAALPGERRQAHRRGRGELRVPRPQRRRLRIDLPRRAVAALAPVRERVRVPARPARAPRQPTSVPALLRRGARRVREHRSALRDVPLRDAANETGALARGSGRRVDSKRRSQPSLRRAISQPLRFADRA